MSRAPEDEYRARLEGRARLLEEARARYRALLDALEARAWEERLRPQLPLLRQVREEAARVEEALGAALRRARAEAWPQDNPTVRGLRELHALTGALARAAARRLGAEEAGALSELLAQVEERVLTAPRVVPPARREAVALELLPDSLPAVREVSGFGALLESLFGRPLDAAGRLPWTAGEVEALRQGWARGEAALAAAWARLEGVDPTRGLVEAFRGRVARGPRGAPGTGPERLVHAAGWHAEARARLRWLARARLAPLEPTQAESREVAWWLGALEHDAQARLEARGPGGEGRAGLLELAHELWAARREGPPGGEGGPWPEARWRRLEERARRAEGARGPDVERVRRELRELILVSSLGGAPLRGWREPPTLEGLVRQARRVAG